MNPPKFSPCLATLLAAGLLLALSVNAAHPAHEGGILLLVPLDTEPTEEQMAQATAEVAAANALDSSVWFSAATQVAANEAPSQSTQQAERERLQAEVNAPSEFAAAAGEVGIIYDDGGDVPVNVKFNERDLCDIHGEPMFFNKGGVVLKDYDKRFVGGGLWNLMGRQVGKSNRFIKNK